MTGTTARDYLTAAINGHHLAEDDSDTWNVQALAMLSIAASLHTISETLNAPTPITGELVAAGCCRRDAQADDLLEYAFGIICSVDGFTDDNGGSWPQQNDEWKQAARKFTGEYNARVTSSFPGSLQDQLIHAKAALANLQADRGAL